MTTKQNDIFKDVFTIENNPYEDNRGTFIKTMSLVDGWLTPLTIKEQFSSINNPGVFRGMHFQKNPMSQLKFIFVTRGFIYDVILDIRKESKTYGRYISVQLYPGMSILVPTGYAHGFLSPKGSIVNYLCGEVYSKEHESGIKHDSFGFSAKNIIGYDPIISDRDMNFKPFGEEDYGF